MGGVGDRFVGTPWVGDGILKIFGSYKKWNRPRNCIKRVVLRFFFDESGALDLNIDLEMAKTAHEGKDDAKMTIFGRGVGGDGEGAVSMLINPPLINMRCRVDI